MSTAGDRLTLALDTVELCRCTGGRSPANATRQTLQQGVALPGAQRQWWCWTWRRDGARRHQMALGKSWRYTVLRGICSPRRRAEGPCPAPAD